jgi:hypothetical protein
VPLPTRVAAVVATGIFALAAGCRAENVQLAGRESAYDVDFGLVAVGQESSSSVTLENSSAASLRLVAVGAPSDPEFSTELVSGASIAANGALTATVTFKPFDVGMKSATIVLVTDSTALPAIKLNLTGQGADLKLLVDPTTVDFGNVVIGSSSTKMVIVANDSLVDVQITPGPITGAPTNLFSIDQTSAFTLAAMGTTHLGVSYQPATSSSQDVAGIDLALSLGGLVHLTFKGTARQNGLTVTPVPVNFGFVQPGEVRSSTLHLANVGNEEITVSSIVISNPGSPAVFAIAPGSFSGGRLMPGEGGDVTLTFSPNQMAEFNGELDVSSTDNIAAVPVTLEGFGGGAVLSCTPVALDFGTVAANAQTSLPVICTNTGSDVPGHPEAGLTITSLRSTNGAFSAQVDPASSPQPLAAHQSLQIDLIYQPIATETDVGVLSIGSNATDGTTIAPPGISLSGNAILEARCFYSITPQTVAFGQVRPGSAVWSGFSIDNVGPNECLVTAIGLSADSQSAFALAASTPVSQRLSPPTTPPGPYPTQLDVNVLFTPQFAGSFAGSVELTLSDPSLPQQRVELTGESRNSCLVLQPAQLDFRTVNVSALPLCAAGKSKVTVINGCAQSVSLESAAISGGGGAYSLVSDSLPLVVPAGASLAPLEVGYAPTMAGTFDGTLLVQTDLQPTPFGVGLSGSGVDGGAVTDRFAAQTPAVDVLLIMDTDDDSYTTFSQHVQDFVSSAQNLNLDFQFGVTSTSDCPNSEPNGEQGRLVPCPGCSIDGTTPTLVTPVDPDAADHLSSLVLLGNKVDGCPVISNDEHFFDVAYKALITNGVGYNTGLIRPGAYLAVIQVNDDDEDEQDPQTARWYADQLLSVKGADHPELFSWSYVNVTGLGVSGGHQPFNALPPRVSAMLGLVGGVALDMTQDKWWNGITDLWDTVIATGNRFPLSGTPDPSTIAVYLDGPPPDQAPPGQTHGVPIAAVNPSNGLVNWSYDATKNILDINNSVLALSSFDTVYVEYALVCQ